jgi:hypothetical protein
MADNGVQELEQNTPQPDNSPQPTGERNAGSPQGAAVAETPAMPGSEDASDSLVRSVYVARTGAHEAASAVDFSHMETAEAGRLLRGAYLTHLAENPGETAGDHEHAGEDVLRRAYVARMVVEPRQQSGRAPRTKKTAAIKQPARSAARNARMKAKRRAAPKPRGARPKRGSR